MADCVGVGWLLNFLFCNFVKFSQNFLFRVLLHEIFLEFREILNNIVKISQNTKFWQNNFEFFKIRGKLWKQEIKNLRNYKNNNFAATLCRSWVRGVGQAGGASSALMQIVHYSSPIILIFHSVIYNSVVLSIYKIKPIT